MRDFVVAIMPSANTESLGSERRGRSRGKSHKPHVFLTSTIGRQGGAPQLFEEEEEEEEEEHENEKGGR